VADISSGVFALGGVALVQLFNLLNAKRDRQFKLEDREGDQRSRLNDLRREAYSRFITQCRKAQIATNVVETTALWQISSDIRILGTREVYHRANAIVEQIAELPLLGPQGRLQIEELKRQIEEESADRQQLLVIPEVKKFIGLSQVINRAIDDFCRAVKVELGYPD
jgi:hypothetical protein